MAVMCSVLSQHSFLSLWGCMKSLIRGCGYCEAIVFCCQFLEAFQMTQMFEGFIEMRELPSKAEALAASESSFPIHYFSLL